MLAFDGVMLLDLSGPAEVFVAANRQVPGAYELEILTASGDHFLTSVGVRMDALAAQGRVQSFGRGRARRWLTTPVPGFPTALLLPASLPTG